MIGIFGAAQSAMKHLSLAVLIGLSALAGVSAYGDTLASWDLTGYLYNESSVPADSGTLAPALVSASLARESSMGKQNSNVAGYGGKGFDVVQTFDEAVAGNKYFDVTFTVADGNAIAPTNLTFRYTSTNISGPSHIRWKCLTNNVDCITFAEGTIKNTGNANTTSQALSEIGVLPAGTVVTLRLYIWGASTSGATFVFKEYMMLYGRTVDPDIPEPPVDPELKEWLELRPGHTIKEDFNAMGGSATADLPAPWRVVSTNALNCFSALGYALENGATTSTTQRAHFGSGTSTSGIYNLGAADNAVDRAVGFLSASGSSNKFRTCALMVPLKNATASAISQFNVQFTWEKWRSGKAKMLNLCYSTGAPAWQWVKLEEFHLGYDASGAALIENDDTNAWAAGEENMEYRHFSRKVNINIPAGGIVYLGWFYSATDTNSGNAQAWAVDDVKIRLGEDRTVIIMR